MKLSRVAFGILPFVGKALSQIAAGYTDTENGITFTGLTELGNGVTFGYVFPPLGSTGSLGNEFIGEIVSPIATKWAGASPAGSMLQAILIVAWPNNGQIVYSARFATDYVQPTMMSGPVLTTISSKVNSTHWKWVYRCQNCVTWSIPGGTRSIPVDSGGVSAWSRSGTAVDNPADPASTFLEHDTFGLFGIDWSSAHVSAAVYQNWVAGGTGGPTPTTSSGTTTTGPTPTVAPTPYDYIVVGAGPGGLVAADRLSEAGKKVILLERGGPSLGRFGGTYQSSWLQGTNLTKFDVPGLFETMFSDSNPFWWCKDISTFAGCLLGGGTAINGALFWYPPGSDFDTTNHYPQVWADNYATYVNKMTARIPGTDAPSTDGKRYSMQVYDIMDKLLKGQGYSNITINSNPNWKDHAFGYPAYSFVGGQRSGPIGSYFASAIKRKNLVYRDNTYVEQVTRNGSQITGVKTSNPLVGPNGMIPLNPKGRVILSAGAFGTPRILFRSGIGPSDMINIVKGHPDAGPQLPPSSQYINLPVGNNVMDNPSISVTFTHPSVDSYDNWSKVWTDPRPADATQYKQNRAGILAQSSTRANFWRAYAHPSGGTVWVQGTARAGACCFTTVYPYNESQVMTITLYLSTGLRSRGRIGIDGALAASPLVDPWLTDSGDRTILFQAVKDVISNINTVPGLNMISPDNTTTIDKFLASVDPGSMGSNHWMGSASMGSSASNSVVDQNVKVWNTNNLFVIDASIMPGLPMGNPHGAIMAAAEQAIARVLNLTGGP